MMGGIGGQMLRSAAPNFAHTEANLRGLLQSKLMGCGHAAGLFTRHLWPLALMKSADRFPISLSRTERLRHCGLIRSPARPVRHHFSPPSHSPRLAYGSPLRETPATVPQPCRTGYARGPPRRSAQFYWQAPPTPVL